ncbi:MULTISPECIES: LysR family transcriptional regulator [unclassified Clostridium]|uniref:LysR family transcriptional regulator n=1 Tax=unclassified Clostridium TaxID=2614128 RepID=UPI00023B0103|nr:MULTISPECIES: LysR family transcriptional regulator [unclassified Clostridium]EHI99843.1 transcriptional regulator, LysR family [Clostridium sp. DL-VIII]OOM69587.1 HTH-type transcriptional regulator CynR [Clostridium sp. BL-8]
MIIDLNLYKTFFTVAKYKNISHAAEVLFVSQPAVSKSIKTLENHLNLKLFSRSSKGVALTPEGEILFKHINNALSELSLGEHILEKLKNKEIGNINLGVSTTIGKSYFLPEFEKFTKEYSDFKIKIINRPTLDTIKLIQEEKLDLGIIGTTSNKVDVKFVKLKEMHDILVASNSYLEKSNFKNTKDIFNRGSFMLLENPNATREHIDNYFASQNLSITPDIEASNMDFLIESAKIGLGITSVIKEFLDSELENKTLIEIPLKHQIPPRYIGVIYKNSSNLSIAAKTLIDFLKK